MKWTTKDNIINVTNRRKAMQPTKSEVIERQFKGMRRKSGVPKSEVRKRANNLAEKMEFKKPRIGRDGGIDIFIPNCEIRGKIR